MPVDDTRRPFRRPAVFPVLILAVAAGLLAAAAPVVRAQVHVCVEPADTTIALGDYVTVRVTADGPPADLKGYSFLCTYNPGVLTLTSTDPGSVLNGYAYTFLPLSSPPDSIGFDAGVLIGSTMGPGILGYFTFQGTAAGICDLVPVRVLMRNSLNQPYPVVTCNGRVRVIPPVPVENTTWSAIKTRNAGR